VTSKVLLTLYISTGSKLRSSRNCRDEQLRRRSRACSDVHQTDAIVYRLRPPLMNSLFWSRVHGGAAHFPIVLIFAATLFETLGFFMRSSSRKHDFSVTGSWLMILSALSSFGAIFSGLPLSKWRVVGTGLLLRHHLFVWPAFALIIGLGTWRFMVANNASRFALAIYLSIAMIACGLIGAAGFFGGEIVLGH
jgi:uncharacterized membrane protein